MATFEEDAVAFLARMKAEFRDVLSFLSSKQAKLLSKSPSDTYKLTDVNEEFLTDMACYHAVRYKSEESRKTLSKALLTPSAKSKELDVEGYEKKRKVLIELAARMKQIIDVRLDATEKELGEVYLPRIVRLCRKFNFSETDSKIAIYALVIQSGYDSEETFVRSIQDHDFDGRVIGYDISCLTCCQRLNITLGKMLEFLDKDRPHMEQGFFPDVQDNYILSSIMSYDTDFCKALIGLKLKNQDFLKIEQTKLADVIAEEPGNEYYRCEGGAMKTTTPVVDGCDQPKDVNVSDDQAIEGGSAPALIKEDKAANIEEHPQNNTMTEEEDLDLDMILRMERDREKARKETAERKEREHDDEEAGEETAAADEDDADPDELKPYKTDLEYLDDHFQLIMYMVKAKGKNRRMEIAALYSEGSRQTQRFQRQKREVESKIKVQANKCKKRLALTRATGSWIPRLERMVESRKLCDFEKNILLILIGHMIQPSRFTSHEVHVHTSNLTRVGELLNLFCDNLEEQIAHRKYFYKSGSLVHEGMVVVHNSGLTGDPSSAIVEVDRRMLDFCVGLDTEFSEIVEGSHLYYPKTKFDQVILPKEQKALILNTVSNFEAYKRCRKKMGLDDAITYGAGMVMLFHGAPGTGKTMMANALANKLEKKVLLINFPSLGSMSAGENFKFIFRESKINDAILFFDECEAIFESREKGGHQVNLLLTEIERHDGLIILATNRPYDLDEAMHRRIMVAIEFRSPDHLLRKAIWESHIPEQMSLAGDVDLNELALRFELTGGFIKNAILSALSIAVSRDGDNPVVCQKDLLQGANLQLRGRLRMKDFDRRVVPNAGLNEVVVEEAIMKQLQLIVQFEKARSVLFGQWGFAKRNHQGLTILLHGVPGTGKTLVAEAIGYEVGKPLKVVNCGELLSKWVGESTKNIDAIFQEARHQDAILVFDEAEGLFGERTGHTTSTDRYANVDVGVLLYHIERFPGIVVLTTNLIDNIDKAFFRRLRYVLQLNVPGGKLRVKLWKLIIPEEAPLAEDVDFEKLARHEMTGGNIKSCVFRAAAAAALREESNRQITMKDLEDACDEQSSSSIGFRRQDSDAARMYN